MQHFVRGAWLLAACRFAVQPAQSLPNDSSRAARLTAQNALSDEFYEADLASAVPFDSVKHYEDCAPRLHQVSRAFAQTEQVLRADLHDPARTSADRAPRQADRPGARKRSAPA